VRKTHFRVVTPDTFAFERADRIRKVAAVLASQRLRDLFKSDADLAASMLEWAPASVDGIDYSLPREPKHRARKTLELLGLSLPAD
jgi:hypothetical protein